jgi:hypothetical protein
MLHLLSFKMNSTLLYMQLSTSQKKKYEVMMFAKNASKREGGSCRLILYSVLKYGKLAACRLFGLTLQSNQTKAEDRFKM